MTHLWKVDILRAALVKLFRKWINGKKATKKRDTKKKNNHRQFCVSSNGKITSTHTQRINIKHPNFEISIPRVRVSIQHNYKINMNNNLFFHIISDEIFLKMYGIFCYQKRIRSNKQLWNSNCLVNRLIMPLKSRILKIINNSDISSIMWNISHYLIFELLIYLIFIFYDLLFLVFIEIDLFVMDFDALAYSHWKFHIVDYYIDSIWHFPPTWYSDSLEQNCILELDVYRIFIFKCISNS